MANFKEIKEKIEHDIATAQNDDQKLSEIIAEIKSNKELRENNKLEYIQSAISGMSDFSNIAKELVGFDEKEILRILSNMNANIRTMVLSSLDISDEIKASTASLNGLSNEQKAEVIRSMTGQVHIFNAIKQIDNNQMKLELAELLDKSSDAYKWMMAEYGMHQKSVEKSIEKPVEEIVVEIPEEQTEKVSEEVREETQTSEKKPKYKMNDLEKAEEIAKWDSDAKKIMRLPFIKYDWGKAIIIASLNNDNKKIKLLKKLEFDGSKAEVIASLADDEKKKELLEMLELEENKDRVRATISNKEKVVEEQSVEQIVEEPIVEMIEENVVEDKVDREQVLDMDKERTLHYLSVEDKKGDKIICENKSDLSDLRKEEKALKRVLRAKVAEATKAKKMAAKREAARESLKQKIEKAKDGVIKSIKGKIEKISIQREQIADYERKIEALKDRIAEINKGKEGKGYEH